KQGYTVITDRYFFSTIAYGKASGLDEDWLREVNGRFIKPDITFVFDIDPKMAITRISARRKDTHYFERLKFLQSTRTVYKRLAKEYDCHVIDGSRDIDTIKD
ncbi:Thymidylate kinase-like protein, partial [mine drainage metagenome]